MCRLGIRRVLWVVWAASLWLPATCGWALEHRYATRDTVELDGCASAWLIKRFIDPEAQFLFYPKGTLIDQGIPFDTPEAKWRRTQKLSTYEQLLWDAKLDDPALTKLAALVHEAEVTYSPPPDGRASALNRQIIDVAAQAKTPHEALEQSFVLLDALYRELSECAHTP